MFCKGRMQKIAGVDPASVWSDAQEAKKAERQAKIVAVGTLAASTLVLAGCKMAGVEPPVHAVQAVAHQVSSPDNLATTIGVINSLSATGSRNRPSGVS